MARHADMHRRTPSWRVVGQVLWTLPARLLMGVVQGYRLLLKPWLGNACRFEPTCSAYTLQALQRHGAAGGVLLGGWRLLRCQPWCEGGCDPVPDHHPVRGLFTRFTVTEPGRPGAATPAMPDTPATPASAAADGPLQPATARSADGGQSPNRLSSSSQACSP